MNPKPVLSPLAKELGLTKKDLFGYCANKRFIVHKLPEHLIRVYNAFGCGENRLSFFRGMGNDEALIFFHPNKDVTELYKTTLSAWLHGTPWDNKMFNGVKETQRLVLLDDCSKDGSPPRNGAENAPGSRPR